MITNYISDVIRLFIESELFPKEDIQELLDVSEDKMDKLLSGSDEELDIRNISCFTKAFGISVFDYSFISEIFTDNYRRGEVHRSLASSNPKVRMLLDRLWAVVGEGNNQLKGNLARAASNKSYIDSCQLMLDCLKDAGMMEADEEDNSVEETEEATVGV
jgi:hypothetical protein